MALVYKIIPVTAFSQNCSVVWCDQSLEGVVVDPGGEAEKIHSVIIQHGLKIKHIVLTHGHLDHVGASQALSQLIGGVDIIGPHLADKFWLDNLPEQSLRFQFPHTFAFEPDVWLNEGDQITFGEQTLSVLHTPGHTPGHVVIFSASEQIAFVGDVLFKGSIGRTDFPQGNFEQLIHSIKYKLWPLGNEMTFIPGHGAKSTFGQERRSNPFVADEMPIH